MYKLNTMLKVVFPKPQPSKYTCMESRSTPQTILYRI